MRGKSCRLFCLIKIRSFFYSLHPHGFLHFFILSSIDDVASRFYIRTVRGMKQWWILKTHRCLHAWYCKDVKMENKAFVLPRATIQFALSLFMFFLIGFFKFCFIFCYEILLLSFLECSLFFIFSELTSLPAAFVSVFNP